MGRHSAPDEDDESTVVTAAPPVAGRPRPGRHANPADDEPDEPADDSGEGLALIQDALGRDRPRPAMPGPGPEPGPGPGAASEDDDETAKIEPIVDPVLDEPVPEAVTEQFAAVPASDTPTSQERAAAEPVSDTPAPSVSDLSLLRSRPALRAQVVAAVIVPFVLYVVVLVTLDSLELRTALIWIWIPLVSAGVFAGLLLDLAHRTASSDRTPH